MRSQLEPKAMTPPLFQRHRLESYPLLQPNIVPPTQSSEIGTVSNQLGDTLGQQS